MLRKVLLIVLISLFLMGGVFGGISCYLQKTVENGTIENETVPPGPESKITGTYVNVNTPYLSVVLNADGSCSIYREKRVIMSGSWEPGPYGEGSITFHRTSDRDEYFYGTIRDNTLHFDFNIDEEEGTFVKKK